VKFLWRGEAYEAVEQSDLTWIEMEKLEEVTGYTSTELGDGKIAGKARVIAATCWMSVQRQDESVTFAEFFGSKLGQFEPQAEGEEEPVAPAPVADDPLGSAGTAGSGSAISGTNT
jgi:hypothetical protein